MIVGILGPGGCGGSFLDWTLHFLSGQNHYTHVDRGYFGSQTDYVESRPLVMNPLLGKTAHQHEKNHPNDYNVNAMLSTLENSAAPLCSFYYIDSLDQGTRHKTNYNSLIKMNPHTRWIHYRFVPSDLDMLFCLKMEKIRSPKWTFSVIMQDETMSVWDKREILSLQYAKVMRDQAMSETVVADSNTYSLAFADMLFNLDAEVHNIFHWAGLMMDTSRYQQWIDIYRQWQNNNHTDFFHDLPLIIKSILDKKSLDLKSYHMTFAREVVIAGHLLYNHNLSLKSWGVTNLSDNTDQWHSILEPNIYHKLEQ